VGLAGGSSADREGGFCSAGFASSMVARRLIVVWRTDIANTRELLSPSEREKDRSVANHLANALTDPVFGDETISRVYILGNVYVS
jgi:hypothetical protein